MYIPREIDAEIKPFLGRKEAIAIVGPRQAGKTTYIKYLAGQLGADKKVLQLTFEKTDDLRLFDDSIEDFKKIAQQFDYVIIDEFQYARNGGKNLKYLYDTTQVKYIVTGSSSLDLTFQIGKFMVGRILTFEIQPFSFREYLSCGNEFFGLLKKNIDPKKLLDFKVKNGFGQEINRRISDELENFVVWGGYPAVALSATDIEKRKVLESITDSYLLKDIKGLLNLATEDSLLRLARFLAAQTGNLIKYEELSNVSNLSYKEILKHLNILEKTFIIRLIRPYFVNRRTELTKNPKSFFVDLGLRNHLLNDFRPLNARNEAGAIMENYALTALEKIFFKLPLKYWRTKSKAEVDFIVEKEGGVIPIEVKYSSKRIIGKSLYSFIDKFKPEKAVILTKDYLAEEKLDGCLVQFIPLGYL